MNKKIAALVTTAIMTSFLLTSPLDTATVEAMTVFNPSATVEKQLAEKKPVEVTLDGKKLRVEGTNQDGVTLVPVDGVFSALGWKPEFLKDQNAVRIFNSNTGATLYAPIGTNKLLAVDSSDSKGRLVELGFDTQIIDGEPYIPIAAIVETGTSVDYDAATRTVGLASMMTIVANRKYDEVGIADNAGGGLSGGNTPIATMAANTFAATNAAATVAQREITVKVDGRAVKFKDQKPVIVNGRTLIPVRGVFEEMGWTVNWFDSTKTATLDKDGIIISAKIGAKVLIYNDLGEIKEIPLDVEAQLINGRTMVPLRAISEEMPGVKVEWDDKSSTVYIITSNSSSTKPDPAPESKPATQTPPKMESGTPIAGTTTPWEGSKVTTDYFASEGLNRLVNQYPKHNIQLKQVYAYSPDWTNPALPVSYTRDGYKFADKIPLFNSSAANHSIAVGDYIGVYLNNGYLIHLGMSKDRVIEILGEPKETWANGNSIRYGVDYPDIYFKTASDGKLYITDIKYSISGTYYASVAKLSTKSIFEVPIGVERTFAQIQALLEPLKDKDLDGSGFGPPIAELNTDAMKVRYTALDEDWSNLPEGLDTPWYRRNNLNHAIGYPTSRDSGAIYPSRYASGTNTRVGFIFQTDGGFVISYAQ